MIDLVAYILGREPQWSVDENIESTIFFALSGRKASPAEADVLRATFVSCVDHTPATPSSLAALTFYSGGSSLKTALAAGISAMGESHAGAGEGTARILTEFLGKMRQAPGGVFEADGLRIADLKPGRLHRQQGDRRLWRREGPDPRLRPPLLRPLRPRPPAPRHCWKLPANWAWRATTARWPAKSNPC